MDASDYTTEKYSRSTSPYVGPFRFKSSVDSKHTHSSSSRSARSHRHRHRHRSRSPSDRDGSDRRRRRGRRHSSRSRSPRRTDDSAKDKVPSPGPAPRELSPDTAFRESLFDAMADDEGAAYWEGVYGQPIHAFGPLPAADGETYEGADYNDPTVLDADAYAAFVRRKMWERSHQHIVEERKRREEQARRRREEIDREKQQAREYREQERKRTGGKGWEDDRGWRKQEKRDGGTVLGDDFESKIEESLRRGERRKEAKRWREAWERYCERWAALLPGAAPARAGDIEGGDTEDVMQLPWPVRSGKQADVNSSAIRNFFQKAPAAALEKSSLASSVDLRAQLKTERVRWHPDKVMQRFNAAVDEKTLKTVTAVFQTVDQMWNELKDT